MPKPKFSYLDLKDEDYDHLESLCKPLHYRVFEGEEIRNDLYCLPSGLLSKSDVAIMASSVAPSGIYEVRLGVNIYRIDDSKYGLDIDQDPFIVGVDNSTSDMFAGLLHHGDYKGRTTTIPESNVEIIRRSGIMEAYPFLEIPNAKYGELRELPVDDVNKRVLWEALRMVEPDASG